MIKIADLIQNYDAKIFKLEEENKKLGTDETAESFIKIFNNNKKLKILMDEQKKVIGLKKNYGNEIDEYFYKTTLYPLIVCQKNKLKR